MNDNYGRDEEQALAEQDAQEPTWQFTDADELVTNLKEILDTLPDVSDLPAEDGDEELSIGGFIMGQNDSSFIIYYGDMLQKGEHADNYFVFPLAELPSLLEAVNAHIWTNTEGGPEGDNDSDSVDDEYESEADANL